MTSSYQGRCRVRGLKITLDGSPQGRTAWHTRPYLIPPNGQRPGYAGYPAIPDTKQVETLFDEAYQKGWPMRVHANGDAAVDQMIAALRPVHARHGAGDRRCAASTSASGHALPARFVTGSRCGLMSGGRRKRNQDEISGSRA